MFRFALFFFSLFMVKLIPCQMIKYIFEYQYLIVFNSHSLIVRTRSWWDRKLWVFFLVWIFFFPFFSSSVFEFGIWFLCYTLHSHLETKWSNESQHQLITQFKIPTTMILVLCIEWHCVVLNPPHISHCSLFEDWRWVYFTRR